MASHGKLDPGATVPTRRVAAGVYPVSDVVSSLVDYRG
jgi:hypothetical protein